MSDVSAADELAFDALPDEVRALAHRVLACDGQCAQDDDEDFYCDRTHGASEDDVSEALDKAFEAGWKAHEAADSGTDMLAMRDDACEAILDTLDFDE